MRYENLQIDENTETTEFESNLNPREPLVDIEGAKSRYRKSILMFLVYFISNVIFYLIVSLVTNDTGLLNAFSVIFSIIPIYLLMGKRALKQTEGIRPSRDLGIFDLLFFVGIMYFLSYIFGHITDILMRTFTIPSVNVTEIIQKSLNVTLFIYAVFIGPILEELNYRGFHLNNTRQYGAYASILLSTLIFSFAHGNFMQGIGTLGIGFVLGYVAYFYSFKDAVILHIINNAIVSLIGLITTFFSEETAKIYLIAIEIIIILIVVYAIISLFTKKRKDNIKQNLKFTNTEKIYLRTLLTDPMFYIYILGILVLMIILHF